MSTVQQATIRYRNALILPETSTNDLPVTLVTAFIRNIQQLGFDVTVELANSMRSIATVEEFKAWAIATIKDLKIIKGAQHNYTPMYPNFPEQVAEASEAELFFNAIMHYTGDALNVRILPQYDKEERFPLHEDTQRTLLTVATQETPLEVLHNLMSSKLAYSEADIKFFKVLFSNFKEEFFAENFPSEIPNKQNLATIAGLVRGNKFWTAQLLQKTNTATDLLRIAAVYSGAHPSLNETFRFQRISRPERRQFINRLFELNNLEEDFNRNRNLWKRFAEKLHPNEFINETSPVGAAFNLVRSNRTLPGWGTAVEAALEQGDILTAVHKLKERPGEFARKLNHLLHNASSDEAEYVIEEFATVADQASTSVLWQALSNFTTLKENRQKRYSTVFTKNVSGAAFALPRPKTHIPDRIIIQLETILREAIQTVYKTREPLGSVYLNTDGYNPAIPFGMQHANNAFKVIGRGTRQKFDKTKTLRFFIHWKDEEGQRVDLDLSAVTLNDRFEKIGEIAYYNLRGLGGYHSGDITSAPDGASEFIDINPQNAKLKKAGRYVAMTVHSYTRQKFSDLTEVLAGFMTRKNVQSGEIYEPSTVANAFTVNSASTAVIPLIFDLKTGEAIWLDTPIQGASWVNNVATTHHNLSNIIQGLVTKNFGGVHDVLTANIEARGQFAATPAEADLIINLTENKQTISFDEIIAKWL